MNDVQRRVFREFCENQFCLIKMVRDFDKFAAYDYYLRMVTFVDMLCKMMVMDPDEAVDILDKLKERYEGLIYGKSENIRN